ncbi:hypothetical protein [Ruminococcus sp.]|uniref:hypothetical protein n=1 Tax=Ruminococcus sp. TaxID=41978 RepID=UPI0025F33067|nr:hypothetical protein [Ruminococcus sp.]MBQ8967594.1 hypothetical protein [Ruminococcus sp.]
MSDTSRVKVYKYKNIAAALAVLLLIMVGISTSCSSRNSNKKKTEDKPDKTTSSAVEKTADDNEKRLTKNYEYKEMQNGTMLNNGLLLQVSEAHPFTGQINGAESLYSFMFDENGEQVLAASYPSDEALPEMLSALNKLAVDFEKDSGLSTLMVSSMVPDEGASPKTDEAYIGSCADLMLYDYYNGTFEEFTGTEDYVWIPNNCYKYGFVMRGTNRLRYIGKEAAELIRFMSSSDGSADFEKMQTAIKEYTFEKPMYYSSDDGTEYVAYFVPADSGSTTTSVPVPTREDESEYKYVISGNNDDGYIVLVNMSDNNETELSVAAAPEDSSAEETEQGEY